MRLQAVALSVLFYSAFASMLPGQTTASVHGSVIDARDGTNIPIFTVTLVSQSGRREENGSQRFALSNLQADDYVLQVDAPGFIEAESRFHLNAGEQKEFQVTLTVETQRMSDVVSVREAPLNDPLDAPGGSVTTISGKQLQNLSSVLADDPMRAVQSLPGVAADNDLEAKFSLRGADFDRVGVFLDGIRIPDPLHSFQGAGLPGSASFFNRSLVDELSLYNSPMPERFGDSSAGVLDVKMRDGSTDAYHFEGGANFAQANFAAEGPFGSVKACSWTAGARKTYLQYLLAGRLPDPSMLFGVQDEQEHSSCQINEQNKLFFDVVDSLTTIDQSSQQKTLRPTALMNAHQHTDVLNLGWLFTPTDKWLISTHAAYIFSSFGEDDASEQPMGSGKYSEGAFNSSVQWFPDAHLSLSGGVDMRDIDASGNTQIIYAISKYVLHDGYSGAAHLLGGFLQQSYMGGGGRLHVAFSERWDQDSADHSSGVSPAGSLSVRVAGPLEVQVGWGRYMQFPDASITGSVLGGAKILPLQSTQESAGFALRLSANTVVRGTVYKRNDKNLPYQPYADPRLMDGQVFFPPLLPMYTNSLSGKATGYEFTVQRRSSHRLSGFASYSHGNTLLHDSLTGNSFVSDWDQRDTVTAYLDYAWRRNIDLSSRYTFGSGFPIPGYFTEVDGKFYFSDQRNQVRLPAYQSLNLRLNKAFPRERWRMNLYFEVVNATNNPNEAWGGITGFNANPKAPILVSKLSQFPVLPSLGLQFVF